MVTVVLTSNAACLATPTATSNPVTMTVTGGAVVPAVSISASATNVCAGTAVTFTATPVNGGSSPAYQWKVNGVGVGTNSATYTTSALSNNDVITCTLTSNAACASPLTANSNSVTMTIVNGTQPTVTISTTTPSICAGSTVNFTASAVNAGTSPSYQWKVNGANVGSNASTYSSSTFASGDQVVCVITSAAQCSSGTSAGSNTVTMTVSQVVVPAVAISTPNTTICSGTSAVFTATPTNGGLSPVYQWKVNGTNTGTNSSLFSSSALGFGDVVTCVMVSNAACATPSTVTSNAITMNVTTSVTPTVSISASPATNVCAGSAVTFTATGANGGSSPVYQWKVNGANLGTNSNTFTTSNLNNGDVVTCSFTSNEVCASPVNVLSSAIQMTVTPIPSAPVATANTPVCEGNILILNAPAVSGATYSWTGPNAFVSSVEDPVINNPTTANSGTYSLVVTVNGCSSAPGTLNVVVNGAPTKPVISQSGNVLTSSQATGNQWYFNNVPVSNANQQNYTATQQGWYNVVVTNTNGCSASSDSLFVTPVGIIDPAFVKKVTVYPNPFSERVNLQVSGSVTSLENWSYSVTDIAGRVISFNLISELNSVINMDDKAAGVYFINITDGEHQATYKVVKKD